MLSCILGWTWIFLGFIWGAALGVGFLEENWLGGYGSPRRRLLRLGHIAMVALGMLNVLFWLAAPRLQLSAAAELTATAGLVTGAAFMPLCCALAAWRGGFARLFPVPAISLIAAAGAMALGAIRTAADAGALP